MAGGRPSKFKPEFAKQAEKLALLGATDVDLADFFEVSINTIGNWKVSYPEFLGALKSGKEQADDRVERSLYQRAVGYSYDAVHFSSFQGTVTETPYREHCPPDTTAQIFWLKNRRPEQWRDKTEQVVRHEIQHMSDDDLTRIASGCSDGAAAPPVGSSKPN